MLYEILYFSGFLLIGILIGIHIHYYHVTVNNKVKFSYLRYAVTILVILVIIGFLGNIDKTQSISDFIAYSSIICAFIAIFITTLLVSKISKSKSK